MHHDRRSTKGWGKSPYKKKLKKRRGKVSNGKVSTINSNLGGGGLAQIISAIVNKKVQGNLQYNKCSTNAADEQHRTKGPFVEKRGFEGMFHSLR